MSEEETGADVVKERWSCEDKAAAYIVDDMGEHVLDYNLKDVIIFIDEIHYLKYHFAEHLYAIYANWNLAELREVAKEKFGKEYTDAELFNEE